MGIWTQDAERGRLIDALTAAWPRGSAPELRWLSEGFGSAAFETEDGLVVLVAKNAVGAHSRRATCALTPFLAPRVPVAVPTPVWSIEEARGLPYGAYAYPKLPGRPWTQEEAAQAPERLASQVTAFILAMNAFPVTELSTSDVTSFQEFWGDTVDLRRQTNGALRENLTAGEYAQVQSWWESLLQDETLQHGPRCLVHGDLWWDNLLVDDRGETLLAVIDFGDAAIIDPAYDFVPLLESGPSLLRACQAAYVTQGGAVDDGFEHRLRRWWELRSGSFFSLRASVVAGDEDELEESIGKLLRSPILKPSRLEQW